MEALLNRSAELYQALHDQLSEAQFDDSIHVDLTLAPAQLALEHGSGIAILVESGRLSSAGVLLRAQLPGGQVKVLHPWPGQSPPPMRRGKG